LLVIHIPREKPNKILKYLLFLTNVILTHLSKKSKLTKWSQQNNKPIKYNHVKKNNIKIIKKSKTLTYSTIIELTFQMVFFPLKYTW
jgi:hypothetical protein